MEDEQLRKYIACLAMRSEGQSKELYNLVDKNIDAYIELECLIKTKATWYVPANRETLEEFVLLHQGVTDEDFWNHFTCDSDKIYKKPFLLNKYPDAFVKWVTGKTEGALDNILKITWKPAEANVFEGIKRIKK